jgi:hypothetical protein
VTAAVVVAAGLVGAGVAAGSGHRQRTPVVWHDVVTDPADATSPRPPDDVGRHPGAPAQTERTGVSEPIGTSGSIQGKGVLTP